MRYALPFVLGTLLLGAAGAAPVPPATAREAAQLIETLGSDDYAEREAATKRLDDLGLLALSELRAATKSDNAEIADRAKDLVKKIERRASNDRALAPTIVELGAKDVALDAVLADLSKQSGFEVVLGGLRPEELAGKKVSVETGKVPFWTAVLKVCDAGGLQVAGAGGVFAPGAAPYLARRAKDGAYRVAANTNNAVVLEAREGKKRPASVHAGVLIEAFELPKGAGATKIAAAVVQVWPEPRLSWQSTADVKLTKTADAKGDKITIDLTPSVVPQVERLKGGKVVVVKNPDGTITLVNPEAANPVPVGINFTPNARQGLIRLRTGLDSAAELTGSVYGLVRSPAEALLVLPLDPENETTATGPAGVEATAYLSAEGEKKFARVKLSYDPLKVNPVRTGDELPDVKLADGSNQTVHGLRVTGADGKAFSPSLANAVNDFDRTGQRRIVLSLKLELPVVKDGPAKPTKLVFWGNYAKPVGVPFTLRDVPLRESSR